MLEVDFFADWADYVKKCGREQYGLSLTGLDDQAAVLVCLNARHQRVVAKQRKVFVSSAFSCPSEHQAGWNALKKIVEGGGDLNKHLSKAIEKEGNYDGLLSDWGIKHFHLGMGLDKKDPNFSGRTGPLVFAWLDDVNFYAINVYNHGDWEKAEILEALHAEWPHVLSRFQVVGLSPSGISDGGRRTARKKKVNVFFQSKDGTRYMPPGGGVMASGDQPQNVIRYDRVRDALSVLERDVKENWREYIDQASKQGVEVSLESVAKVKLEVTDDCLAMLLPQEGVRFRFTCASGKEAFRLCCLEY